MLYIDQINEDTKLKEFTQWVLDQWEEESEESEVNNDKV